MTDTNFAAARHNMVVSQIRTWDVFDDRILELVSRAPRQDFVPEAFRNMAFADMPIPLGHGEVMMAPLVEARFLQALAIRPTDSVLEVGTGSGYVTWLLTQLGKQITSIEIRGQFTERAAGRLSAHGANNVTLEVGDGARGWSRAAPYDVIFVTGSMPLLADEFKQQLRPGGRLAVVTGDAPVMEAKLITRVNDAGFDTQSLFETVIPPLQHALAPERFRF